jgi:hypothetical protein
MTMSTIGNRKFLVAITAAVLLAGSSLSPASARGLGFGNHGFGGGGFGHHGFGGGFGGGGFGGVGFGVGLLSAAVAATAYSAANSCWQMVQPPHHKSVMVNTCAD